LNEAHPQWGRKTALVSLLIFIQKYLTDTLLPDNWEPRVPVKLTIK
jgi:hypothetical protein